MADEFDIVHGTPEEIQEIIDWAVRAAALVILMETSPEANNVDESLDKLEGFKDAVKIMVDSQPELLISVASDVAQDSLERIQEEDEAVEEFREQLKEL